MVVIDVLSMLGLGWVVCCALTFAADRLSDLWDRRGLDPDPGPGPGVLGAKEVVYTGSAMYSFALVSLLIAGYILVLFE